MSTSAADLVFALPELWQQIVNFASAPDLPQLRLVCRRANEAAARRDFRHLLFKTSRNAYAPGRLRSIRSLQHVRVLRIDKPSLLNLRRLLDTMDSLAVEACREGAEPAVEAVDLAVSLSLVPQIATIFEAHPWARRALRSLRIYGQEVNDYAWHSAEAGQWWQALANLLEQGDPAACRPLRAFIVSPEFSNHGLYWPAELTNGPRKQVLDALARIVAPNLEVLCASLSRRQIWGLETASQTADTFFAITQIAWPKLRRLMLSMNDMEFVQPREKQDYDALFRSSPLLEEIDISADVSFPLRMRTHLTRLRHLKLRLAYRRGQKDHVQSVRNEVRAFIMQHREQLVSLSVVFSRNSRQMNVLFGGAAPYQPDPDGDPEWDDFELDPADFPKLVNAVQGIRLRKRTKSWIAGIKRDPSAGPREPTHEPGFWDAKTKLLKEAVDLSSVTALELACQEPYRVEKGAEFFAQLYQQQQQQQQPAALHKLNEVILDQTVKDAWMRRGDENKDAIWNLLKALAPLSGVRALQLAGQYASYVFVGQSDLERADVAVPEHLEFIKEKNKVYRLLRSASTTTSTQDDGSAPRPHAGTTFRLQLIHDRHLPEAHGLDVFPELRMADLLNLNAPHPSVSEIADATILEHLDAERPTLRGF